MLPRCSALATLILFCWVSAALSVAAEPPAAQIDECRIGFDGLYKLGCWTPVRVMISGVENLVAPCIEITAPDGDGAPATLRKDLPSGAKSPCVVESLTRVGRTNAVIRVSLLDGKNEVFRWRSDRQGPGDVTAVAATSRLTVEVGAKRRLDSHSQYVAHLSVGDLPTNRLAYEGVDRVILSTTDEPQRDDWKNDERSSVLLDWVQQGGRIVLSSGLHAEQLLGTGQPLTSLAPGTFREVVRLTRTGAIEGYASSEQPLEIDRLNVLSASRFDQPRGTIELYEGGRATEMPLVVRRTHGFGEVTFVAFDLDHASFWDWKGRERLMRLLLGQSSGSSDASGETRPQLVAKAYNDLSGAVQVKLGASYRGVKTVSMTTLVSAAIGYLLLIGPATFFLGSRVLNAMHSVWITLPLVALLIGGGAYWYGMVSTGTKARVNAVQVIDVDTQASVERGVLWAQVFSPNAELYNLSLSGADQGYLAWHGLSGRGLGGMQSPADSLLAEGTGYTMSPTLSGLNGVPINRRGARAMVGRWTSRRERVVAFDLQITDSGLVDGVLQNDTSEALTDCKLAYGNWAWRLPDLPPGGTATIDGGVPPARLRTLLLRDFGDRPGQESMAWSSVDRMSVPALTQLMMFHQKLGGETSAMLGNRYQAFVDLSHAIRNNRPILIASSAQPRVTLLRDDQPLDPEADVQAVLYRFIGPPLQAHTHE